MANDKSAARQLIENIMSGYKLNATGNLEIVSEDSVTKARELFNTTIKEQSRSWWVESKEESKEEPKEDKETEVVSEEDTEDEEVTESFNFDSIFEDGNIPTPADFAGVSGAPDGSSGNGIVNNAGSGYSEGSSGDGMINGNLTSGSSGDGVMPITGDGASGFAADMPGNTDAEISGSPTTPSLPEGDGLGAFDLSFLDHDLPGDNNGTGGQAPGNQQPARGPFAPYGNGQN